MSEQRRRLLLAGAAAAALLVIYLVGRGRRSAETPAVSYVAPLPDLGGGFGSPNIIPEPREPIAVDPGGCIYDPNTGQMVCTPTGGPTLPAPKQPPEQPPVAQCPEGMIPDPTMPGRCMSDPNYQPPPPPICPPGHIYDWDKRECVPGQLSPPPPTPTPPTTPGPSNPAPPEEPTSPAPPPPPPPQLPPWLPPLPPRFPLPCPRGTRRDPDTGQCIPRVPA